MISIVKGSHHITTKLTLFTVNKDEWHTKEEQYTKSTSQDEATLSREKNQALLAFFTVELR